MYYIYAHIIVSSRLEMHFSTHASEGNFLRSLPNGLPLRYKPGDSLGKFPLEIRGAQLYKPVAPSHCLTGDFCAFPL